MRLELSQKTDLATKALLDLGARGDTIVKGAALASRLGTTVHYLPQVMKPLVAAGWVHSEPGPSGGYRITPRGRAVSMRQVIEAVEGPIADGRCALRGVTCPPLEPCAVHHAWSRARLALIEELTRILVFDTANNNDPKETET